jgi:hypothetical protein
MVLNILHVLIILGVLLSFVYNQEIYYEDVRKEFTESLIRIYCPASNYENETTTLPLTFCYERISHNIRSLKLAEFYNRKRELENKITSFYHVHDLLIKKPDPTSLLYTYDYSEVGLFHEKLQLLQDYADNKQVSKICIIGSNLGYSLLNFLIANPFAHFLVFDNIDAFLLSFSTETAAAAGTSTLEGQPQQMSGEGTTTMLTEKKKVDRGSINILSKITLEMLIEMFPDRIINIISGNTISSLSNFNKEFPDKMDCNLLFIDGQKQLLSSLSSSASSSSSAASSTATTPSTSFLSDLRQAIQLLSPTYNRLILDSYHLSDLSSLFSYYLNKINEKVECPSKIALKQRKSCLQKNLQQNLQTMTQQQQQQGGSDSPSAALMTGGASCENCCNVRLNYRQKEKGFLLTPCIAMYGNITSGSHIEFVFDYNNCQMNYFFEKIPTTRVEEAVLEEGSVESTSAVGTSRYSTVLMDYNNGGKSELLIDSIHELVVVELQYL